jgi:succinylglutamate desuccinylase
MLQIRNELPEGFLDVPAPQIRELIPQPTLIHLDASRDASRNEPVFVSVLLHGNENVGLKAVQRVLRERGMSRLPRPLSIFVGNVEAARVGQRRLNGQPDYNRIWPGTEAPPTPEHEMMQQVVEEMRRRKVFVSIDLHNNTGTNPHYACVCSVENRHLHLASLFSRTVVYFTRPKGVQTMAFMDICPSVTCECGKVGDESGIAHAAELIDACLHASEIPDHPLPEGDVHLFHTVATVKVPPAFSIGFGDEEADLMFTEDVDRWNFTELGPGAELAIRRHGSEAHLYIHDEHGQDCRGEFIAISGDSLRLKRSVLPSMLTLDKRVIRQDCLCYFMERYPLSLG